VNELEFEMVELNTVIQIIGALDVVPDMSKFDPDKNFKENGLDSLDTMSVFLAIEEQFGKKFNADEVDRINSASELVTALNALDNKVQK
jgi:acyl carrier protein